MFRDLKKNRQRFRSTCRNARFRTTSFGLYPSHGLYCFNIWRGGGGGGNGGYLEGGGEEGGNGGYRL